ncbi:MAG TPA: efflux RND transporter periplasmic adaptor subunit [Longimicrobiales bacterium]|nr:efflux RND transporter periplasmic adaptor subunit [Longimicrobiales bacterium]
MRIRKWGMARAAALPLLAALGLSACNRTEAEVEEASPEIVQAEQRTLDIRAEAAGLVEPITTVEIKSKAAGEVTAVLVESGQEVTRGTLLVEIEPRDVRNAFSQAEADLAVAKARAQTSEAQHTRVQQLRQANVATEQELESAQLEQANARAALVKAEVNLELARERMNDVTIRAPMNGMIIEKTVEPGVIISSASGSVSGGTVLLKMADLSVVQVRALVDQTDIGRVQPGQTARVSVEAFPNRTFDGQVVKIEPQAVVDQNVTMFPVLIHLDNAERLLKPGMNTEIEIQIARRPDAVVIPNDAVVNVRDVLNTAIALGLAEDEAQKRVDAMREAPLAKAQTPNEGAAVSQTGSAPQAASGGPTAPSAECQQVMRRVRAARESGQSASEEDRAKARTCFAQMGSAFSGTPRGGDGRGGSGGRGGARGGGQNRQRATTRPAVVFVPTANGPEPRQVVLGYSDLDFTEVISGLKAGDQVFLVTAARLLQQQRESQERMRERMQGPVPGMTGGPTPGRGR